MLKTLKDATVVPAAAVQQGANGRYVYRVKPENGAKLTPVRVTRKTRSRPSSPGAEARRYGRDRGFASLEDGTKVRWSAETGDAQGQPPRSAAGQKEAWREWQPAAGGKTPAIRRLSLERQWRSETARDGNGQGKKSSDKPERAQ